CCFIFFFQAEDGIRDSSVTGVQTCALPISLALVRDVGFDQSFSFIYSRRPGTPAASLPDEATPEIKQERLARLQAQLDTQARAKIGRASCRERVRITVRAAEVKKTISSDTR